MAKKMVAQVKIQITAGKATPAPPVGTALGPHGINLGQFVKQFNDRTADITGTIVPAIVTVYSDRSFDFVIKSPPAAILLKQAAKVEKGAANPLTQKIGKVTKAQVLEIAKKKMEDLNTEEIGQAIKVIAGTARSMGIEIVD